MNRKSFESLLFSVFGPVAAIAVFFVSNIALLLWAFLGLYVFGLFWFAGREGK